MSLDMKRPLGVTVIGCFCLATGVYLCSISSIMLVVPGAVRALKGFPFVHGLKLVTPYATLVVGVLWALVAWGLFRLRDWARWAAQIVLAIGVAWTLPMMYFNQVRFGWRMVADIAELALRALAIGYLFAPKVMDAFLNKRTTRQPSPSSLGR